jgi:hypothetical protein
MAAALIPEAMLMVTGTDTVSPIQPDTAPMLVAMFCDLRMFVTKKKTKQKNVNFKFFMDGLWCDSLLFRWKFL